MASTYSYRLARRAAQAWGQRIFGKSSLPAARGRLGCGHGWGGSSSRAAPESARLPNRPIIGASRCAQALADGNRRTCTLGQLSRRRDASASPRGSRAWGPRRPPPPIFRRRLAPGLAGTPHRHPLPDLARRGARSGGGWRSGVPARGAAAGRPKIGGGQVGEAPKPDCREGWR